LDKISQIFQLLIILVYKYTVYFYKIKLVGYLLVVVYLMLKFQILHLILIIYQMFRIYILPVLCNQEHSEEHVNMMIDLLVDKIHVSMLDSI